MIGPKLQQLRKSRRWSIQRMADELGIAKSTYAGYETGYREPSLDTIRKAAVLLQVSVDELLGTTPPKEPSRGGFDAEASGSGSSAGEHPATGTRSRTSDQAVEGPIREGSSHRSGLAERRPGGPGTLFARGAHFSLSRSQVHNVPTERSPRLSGDAVMGLRHTAPSTAGTTNADDATAEASGSGDDTEGSASRNGHADKDASTATSSSTVLPELSLQDTDPELGLWFKELLEAPEERRAELRQIWDIIKQREAGRSPGQRQGE
ncbi:helix-turn-helix domain-containing protein [Paenibacillus hamazuiensis]|uniref:helix-turn-helix domain-containing protein n=1 Tax=Paenibacillus hamazuiensis TaxID=2936508 RepID=UPI00200C8156|nr:helix-turn-helix transcriptional regulator [Paenibacillus hamazuiensis]